MDNSPFHLQAHVDNLYEENSRQFAFHAQTKDAFYEWQQRTRSKLQELLGLTGRDLSASPLAESLWIVDRGDYHEEKLILHSSEDVKIPIYILQPKTPPPYKPILAFHGHDPSVQYILGNYPNPQIARQQRSQDANYAQALAQAGYLVVAVEQRGFGERITEQYDISRQSACRHLSFEYLLQGRTMIGERCWDGMMALTYIQSRDDVVPGTIGCTGHSGGGTTALWLSAMDERITVCIVSGCFSTFKHSILGVEHCECNYVPGILACCEMGDLAALIAPRPLLLIAGEHDSIFPLKDALRQFEIVRQAYTIHSRAEQGSLASHSGGHAYNQPLARNWFQEWLK